MDFFRNSKKNLPAPSTKIYTMPPFRSSTPSFYKRRFTYNCTTILPIHLKPCHHSINP